jgi:hypothetical protein
VPSSFRAVAGWRRSGKARFSGEGSPIVVLPPVTVCDRGMACIEGELETSRSDHGSDLDVAGRRRSGVLCFSNEGTPGSVSPPEVGFERGLACLEGERMGNAVA